MHPKDPDPTIAAEKADAARQLGQELEKRFGPSFGEPTARTKATATVTLTLTIADGFIFDGSERIEDIHRFAASRAKELLNELINASGRTVKLGGIHSIAISLHSEPLR